MYNALLVSELSIVARVLLYCFNALTLLSPNVERADLVTRLLFVKRRFAYVRSDEYARFPTERATSRALARTYGDLYADVKSLRASFAIL